MKQAPCKDCDSRTITCHGVCEEYKAWKAQSDDRRETRYKEKSKRYLLQNRKRASK